MQTVLDPPVFANDRRERASVFLEAAQVVANLATRLTDVLYILF